jgi:hypothetical protein
MVLALSFDMESAHRSLRVASAIVVVNAAIGVGGCAPPGPELPRPGPLAAFDEREDADGECSAPDDDGGVLRAGSTCDAARFGDASPQLVDEPTYSLCACADIDARNTVTSQGSGGRSDDVGANAGWVSSSPIDIAGVLTSGSSLRADNTLAVDGLRVDDMLTGSSDVHVRGDAVVGGMEFPQQRVTVDGVLTVPTQAGLDGLLAAGEVVHEDVDVATPCDCDHDPEAELPAFADFDGDVPDPDMLVGLSEPTTLYFGCADIALRGIQAANELTFVITGHTRMWIDGDVEVSGPFAIEVEPGASLDLYVGGRFVPTNTVSMGNADDPEALAVWVGEHVQLASPWELYGTLYAPAAAAIVSNTLELGGAIFARSFELSSPVTLREGPRFTGDACVLWGED